MKKVKLITMAIAFVFILALATTVNAATKKIEPTYTKLEDGKYKVTVTFTENLTGNNWEGWATSDKTATRILNSGDMAFLETTDTNGESEIAIIAVPIDMKKNQTITLATSGKITLTDIKVVDTTIATVNENKITTLKVGNTNVTAKAKMNESNDVYDYVWRLNVTEENKVDTPENKTTDFSKAKYSWNDDIDPDLLISDVVAKENKFYTYEITANKDTIPTKPTTNENNASLRDNKLTIHSLGNKIALNQDMYLWIWEGEELVLKGQKLAKPEIKKGIKAWNSSSFIASSDVQILLMQQVGNLKNNPRKMNIRIGRITDNSLLNKLKENPNTEELLTYAKTKECIYNNTVTTNWHRGYKEKTLPNFDSSKLIDGAYYFVYAELENEDGKYIPIENVTFTQAKTYAEQGAWYLFLYGSSDFKWSENLSADSNQDDKKVDNTQSDKKIPQTGAKATISIVFASIVAIGIAGYLGYRRYNGIK